MIAVRLTHEVADFRVVSDRRDGTVRLQIARQWPDPFLSPNCQVRRLEDGLLLNIQLSANNLNTAETPNTVVDS
jgi:hypothetical protein